MLFQLANGGNEFVFSSLDSLIRKLNDEEYLSDAGVTYGVFEIFEGPNSFDGFIPLSCVYEAVNIDITVIVFFSKVLIECVQFFFQSITNLLKYTLLIFYVIRMKIEQFKVLWEGRP